MNRCNREKKRENSSEFFTHGLGETIRVFNKVFSKMSCAKEIEIIFCNNLVSMTD